MRAGHLYARHQNGQTFLVWDEQTVIKGERYRVYRSGRPISTKTLDSAVWLAEVSRGSGNFYADRYYNTAAGEWQARYFRRYPTGDNSPELDPGLGLLVWTPSREDLDNQDSGDGYYAVTIALPDGSEQLLPGYSIGPVVETVSDPAPIDARYNPANKTHVMIQYMDLRDWNATFHAPNEANRYYGLRPDPDTFPGALQYAYDYILQEPFCPDNPTFVPVILVLHGRRDYNDLVPGISNEMSVWCAYKIYALDPGDTWWFGFGQSHDYRANLEVEDNDAVSNYTERRVLRMIYDLIQRPPGPRVDINRIYVTGHSMGGTGALALAMRYGNLFAAAYASDPITNPAQAGPEIEPGMRVIWGNPRLRLPVSLSAPGGWADPLQTYSGADVWEWQNLIGFASNRTVLDFAPVGIAHSLNDPVVNWQTQAENFYSAMDKSAQAWGGLITRNAHNPQDYNGFPPNLQPNEVYMPFAGLSVVRNETVPGISSGRSTFVAPAREHGYNQNILWSSSWLPWDQTPIDTPDYFEISLCAVASSYPDSRYCGTGEEQVVNITPRRLQKFTILPGVRYEWENRRRGDDLLVGSGRATASSDGTLTIRNVRILPDGNRLIIRLPADLTNRD